MLYEIIDKGLVRPHLRVSVTLISLKVKDVVKIPSVRVILKEHGVSAVEKDGTVNALLGMCVLIHSEVHTSVVLPVKAMSELSKAVDLSKLSVKFALHTGT